MMSLTAVFLLNCGFVKYSIPVASYQMLSLSESYIKGEMGKREVSGKNDGEHIVNYMNATGLSGYKNYPYCAAGQAWAVRKAVDSLNLRKPFGKYSAVANYYFDYAKKVGKRTENAKPKRHDYIIWKSQNSYSGHIERVKTVVNEHTVLTYGFNTSNGKTGSQREGNGNYIRKRHLKSFLGRLRLRGLVGWDYPTTKYNCSNNPKV